jgi:hypothetical protein
MPGDASFFHQGPDSQQLGPVIGAGSASGGGTPRFDGLADTSFSDATVPVGNVPIWNGSAWVTTALSTSQNQPPEILQQTTMVYLNSSTGVTHELGQSVTIGARLLGVVGRPTAAGPPTVNNYSLLFSITASGNAFTVDLFSRVADGSNNDWFSPTYSSANAFTSVLYEIANVGAITGAPSGYTNANNLQCVSPSISAAQYSLLMTFFLGGSDKFPRGAPQGWSTDSPLSETNPIGVGITEMLVIFTRVATQERSFVCGGFLWPDVGNGSLSGIIEITSAGP